MRTVQVLLLGVSIFFAGARGASPQTSETGFLNRTIVVDGAQYRYQVYLPREYRRDVRWPVIMALHGAGEQGDDGLVQTDVGFGHALRRHADRFPAIVIFPQSPLGVPGFQGLGERIALGALEKTTTEFNTDPSRVYLVGLSMGGSGAWYLAYHHPDRFAALVIACGFINDLTWNGRFYPAIVSASIADPFADVAQHVSKLPIWLFHGDADRTVSVEQSRRMVSALRALGADVQYAELPGVGHNAWDPAFDRADLALWLFMQQRR